MSLPTYEELYPDGNNNTKYKVKINIQYNLKGINEKNISKLDDYANSKFKSIENQKISMIRKIDNNKILYKIIIGTDDIKIFNVYKKMSGVTSMLTFSTKTINEDTEYTYEYTINKIADPPTKVIESN